MGGTGIRLADLPALPGPALPGRFAAAWTGEAVAIPSGGTARAGIQTGGLVIGGILAFWKRPRSLGGGGLTTVRSPATLPGNTSLTCSHTIAVHQLDGSPDAEIMKNAATLTRQPAMVRNRSVAQMEDFPRLWEARGE